MRHHRPGYADRLWARYDRVRHNDPAAPWLLPLKPRKLVGDGWADEAWRMWHQKEPRELLDQKYELPPEVVPVGKAKKIFYSSDKWEEDGDFYTYYHDFDSHPTVYVPETSSWAKYATGGKPIDVADTLEMSSLHDEVRLPMLAKTLELIAIVDDDDKSRRFRGHPPLCCTRDLKTIVIFAHDGPVIIRGGKMTITERGIVR